MSIGVEFVRRAKAIKMPKQLKLRPINDESQKDGSIFNEISANEKHSRADGRRNAVESQHGYLFAGLEEETSEEDKYWYKNPVRLAKVVLLHFTLMAVLLIYIAVMAAILQRIEGPYDLEVQRDKFERLQKLQESIVQQTWTMHNKAEQSPVWRDRWAKRMRALLVQVSQHHEGGPLPTNSSEAVSRWTFPSAALYVLTVITTCGYDAVAIGTDGGRIFSVVFGLLGIPIAFIAAADIGKFFTTVVIYAYKKIRRRISELKKKFGIEEDEDAQINAEDPHNSVMFAVSAYIGLICLYCLLGSLLYFVYERWPLVRSFHFSYNTITTVGLGNVVVEDYFYLLLNIAYIIVGLAVVTSCIDLASSSLREWFTKIHYFGRPHKGVDDAMEKMRMILMKIRRKRGGGQITWEDLKLFVDQATIEAGRPFVPGESYIPEFFPFADSC